LHQIYVAESFLQLVSYPNACQKKNGDRIFPNPQTAAQQNPSELHYGSKICCALNAKQHS
jgi:hypothetical protein